MNCSIIKSTILTLTLALAGVSHAQQAKPQTKPQTNKWAIGGKISNFYDLRVTYFDVLNNGFSGEDVKGLNGSKTKFDLGFGLDVAYFWTPVVSVDLGFDFGTITGANKIDYYKADINFLQLGVNFDLKTKYRNKPYSWVPYVRASVGRTGYDAKRYFIEDDGLFNTESRSTMVTGLGMGLRYHFNDNVHALLQSEYTVVYSDGMDGYNYGTGRDHLLKTSLGIRYTFGSNPHNDRGLAWQGGESKSYDDIIKKLNDSLQIERARVNKANDDIAKINQMLTVDTDKDGVPDIKDHCPTVKGDGRDGCMKDTVAPAAAPSNAVALVPAAPILAPNKQQALEPLIKDIYFAPGQFEVSNQADKERLVKLGKYLAANPEIALSVVGIADGVGDPEKNKALSEKRAKSVYDLLIKNGASKDKIDFVGLGSISKNENQAERKVEFILQPE